MTVLGIDIGYSNLKLACGDPGGEPRVVLRPAGAAPADRLGEKIASDGEEDFLRVLVNGEPFVSGLSPDRAELWSRELHEDYPSTASYRALFHAGLLLSELEQIDRVVTGLPVNQYLDPALRERLAGQMRGEHQITPRRRVTVSEVKVVPQPVGGFVDYVWGLPDASEIEDSRVLVVDPGFFSVDWLLISNGELRRQSCGTSLEASSVILDEAVRLIAQDFGGNVGRERLEHTLRKGHAQVRLLGERVEIAPYVKKAADKVGPIVTTRLRESLRKENASADLVLLVGGGAGFFEEAIKDAFPQLKVSTTEAPVFANVRGFWRMGA
ncbi:ParM/StbA family protein [Candidatus Accumulibacter sp. ACC007]|uniref:ParM/StbA family protein n=1 Tax=Candidatus Accumulibacter sp. ACC007 TaxID=2823333 RepID=UPI0025C26032|nr:ParM/StbA family protein [Candidatus Accumulibacter sp. ACC007]